MAVALLVGPLAADARAEGPPVLFVAPRATAFGARVRAEIEAMGFSIEPVEALDDAAHAVAAARVMESPPPKRVELWIREGPSGRFALRAVIQASPGEDDSTQTVRASEQLRAFFQPLRDAAPRTSQAPSDRTPIPADLNASPLPAPLDPAALALPDLRAVPLPALLESPAPSAKEWRFTADAGLGAAPQTGGVGMDLLLRARWMPNRVLGLGLSVDVPLLGSTVTSGGNAATVSATLFGAEVSAGYLERSGLRLAATAGIAVAWVHTMGFATGAGPGVKPVSMQPVVYHAANAATAVTTLGIEVAPRLTPRLFLVLSGRVGISLPAAEIAFVTQTVGTWGRPVGLVTGGAGVEL
jgi:hypothetical protein